MLVKWFVAAVGMALIAAACSADPTALNVEEYAVALQAVETDFDSAAPDPSGQDRTEYPLGGDLVAANDLYMYYEDRLDGWRAITPPAEMTELHIQLVEALDALQQEVGDYLGEHAMTGSDFDSATIGPAVGPFLSDAVAACRELRSALSDAGAEVDFVDSCNF